MKMTPTLGMTGKYTLLEPWTARADIVYRCTALRQFKELLDSNVDIYTDYYEPKKLDRTVYEADLAKGATLCALYSEAGDCIYVPDTYIASYPDSSQPAYQHVVLSISLGLIPKDLSLDFLCNTLATDCSEVIGVVPKVAINVAPTTGVMSQEQAELLEKNRLAAIKNRVTDRAKLLATQKQLAEAEDRVKQLEKLLIDNSVVKPPA